MATLLCKKCAFESPAGFRFCGQCGNELENDCEDTVQNTSDYGSPRADRRQLTVLFCDLVGSTELSRQLDPEDLRSVIRFYQTTCGPEIKQLGGYVSRYVGDGILAIFGYPRASEDDAARAVQAGINIISAIKSIDWVSRFDTQSDVAVRVGIATGVVIAGDLIGEGAAEQEAVVGETPNLAARLQGLAEPNTVIVGERTQRLVQEQFALSSIGQHQLKGFPEPVEAWRADASKIPLTRFAARLASGITPLVNRHEAMKVLVDGWERAKQGNIQIVVISGEPGIGKSRVIEALRERIADEPHYFLGYQCSAYHSNTALYPITTHIERAARITPQDSNAVKREKLLELLRRSGAKAQELASAFSALLSIPNAPDDEFEQLSARDKKNAILNALIAQIVSLSGSRAILAVIEDVHWSDPTSRELVSEFFRHTANARVLILLTSRNSEFQEEQASIRASHIHLDRLEQKYALQLVRTVVDQSMLSDEIIERVVSKTDGIPLFAEELTKSLQSKALRRSSDGNETELIDDSEIPDTLHDLLMARLDSLGPGKRVAQIAATIGRQFSFELLERIADINADELHDGFSRLSQSDLVIASDSDQAGSFSFKHALIRDTAYSSLLRGERREFHKRVAAVLEAGSARNAPELLARHYTEAGLDRQAIKYWLLAGQEASQRSAYREAVKQFNNGISLLRKQSPSEQRSRTLLEYLVNLGPAQIATSGSGHTATEAVYREALSLLDSLPESEDHFTAMWGWWRISNNFVTDAERADKLQQLADRLGDEGLKLQAHHCQWATRFHLGDHQGCLQHIDVGLNLYADGDYRSHAARYGGHDPLVCAHGEAAQSLWMTGHPDQAKAQMQRARKWAEELKQFGSLVHVMDMNLLLLRYQNAPDLAAEQADELIAFAQEHQFPEYIAKAEAFKGWALAKSGMIDEGIRIMMECITLYDALGTHEDPPVWLEMLAEIYIDIGEYQAGLAAIEQAFRHTGKSGLRFWDAELHRRRGELLWLSGPDHVEDARKSFEQAIEISTQQGARMLQLRSLMSLLRSSADSVELSDYRVALTDILETFEEGLDTPDVIQARELVKIPDAK